MNKNTGDGELELTFSDLVQLVRKEYSNERDNIGYQRAAKIVDKAIEPQLAAYSREARIDDREVLIGMFEANKDNISVGEIIATLKGQVESIKTEPEGKPNE
jgi:hypothetical protein